MELSAITSTIAVLEGLISNAIYDLLKSRLENKSLRKDEVESIVCDALHETQEIYLKKFSEMLSQALGVQNQTLISSLTQRIQRILEQYKIPDDKVSISRTQEPRQIANEIAQDISSRVIERSQVFLLVSKEMLRGNDFKRSPFIFAQAERFLGRSSKIFHEMLEDYLVAVEEEANRRSSKGDQESALSLYKLVLPPYRLILHDTRKSVQISCTLADRFF